MNWTGGHSRGCVRGGAVSTDELSGWTVVDGSGR